ncbi:hypothetical protein Drorol1_Dr00001943 [Drosera rotundifolia]
METEFDFDLEKNPSDSSLEVEENGIGVSVNGAGIAGEVPPVFDWGELDSSDGGEVRVLDGESGGGDGGKGDGEFGRARVSAGGDGEGVEYGLIDLNRGVKYEESVLDFDEEDDGVVGDGVMGGGSGSCVSVGRKDGDDEYIGDSKVSGADDGYRLHKHGGMQHVSSMNNATGGVSRAESSMIGFGFEIGDMVWGKVKSHPWWPGYIFNEAFVSSQVRHTKRDGHALVAFFGDSSYGWFEAAELIPYEPNYAEKWQQTSSRNFVKAVEESEDEVSRRAALGLSCRCRNPFNFRPASMQGYFSVDVVDYEPGGIYSAGQIKKAREGFQPCAMLSFVKQLALAPNDVERKTINFIRTKSMSLTYRRAIFEEFDETYAQAFGQQLVRPSRLSPRAIDQSVRDKGLFSGRQVFAEALGGRKSSGKPLKSKELAKKDRYLFKRRDELNDSPAYKDEPSPSSPVDFVLQRRDPVVSLPEERVLTPRRNDAAVWNMGTDAGSGPGRIDELDSSGKGLSAGPIVTAGREMHVLGRNPESGKKIKASKRRAGDSSSEKSDSGQKKKRKKVGSEPGTGDSSKQPLVSSGRMAEKAPEIAVVLTEEPKLRDPRRDVEATNLPSPSALQVPQVGNEESEVKFPELLGDLQALALNPFHGTHQHRPAIVRQVLLRFRSLVFQKSLAAQQPPAPGLQEAMAARPPVISGPPANAAVSPTAATVGVDPTPGAGTATAAPTSTSSAPAAAASATAAGENVRSMPPTKLPKPSKSLKPSKPMNRLEDPTRAGKKRAPLERPEETTVKKTKKLGDAKPTVPDYRAAQKTAEVQQIDNRVKDAVSAATPTPTPQRKLKAGSLKRNEPPRRVQEPTYLVIKLPPGSSLPTSMELKAKFARFGSMESEGNRVFYKTTTLRVLFHFKDDAERAKQYAESVFPNANTVYLKPLSGKGEDTVNEPTPALPQAPAAPPKSILKKPNGDDTSPGARGARVRFNVGDDANAREEVQTMDYRNKNTSFDQDATGPSSSVAMDLSSNQKVISTSSSLAPLPPLLPFPAFSSPASPQYSRAVHHQQHVETVPRPHYNYNLTMALPSAQPPSVDISQQMMNLLLRCNDIVTNVTSTLGYVPYHPL